MHVRKEQRSKINNLSSHLRKLEKGQIKSKVSRKKIRAKINEIKNRKSIENIKKPKADTLKRSINPISH